MKTNFTKQYQKDDTFENVIDSLNEHLFKVQGELYQPFKEPVSIHIIGAPRSGTTLLTQIILSSIQVGYINNFIATFWKAPLYGIYLSKKLLGLDYISNFSSEFGRTNEIQEPHEFGYFWKYHLNYKDHLQKTYDRNHLIKWEELKNILSQMYIGFERPIVFKSFLYGFHATQAVKELPKSIFIYIERDVIQNAYSILKLRKKMFNNFDNWASMKPIQFNKLKNMDIYKQVVGQVLYLNYEYRKQLDNIPQQNKLLLDYDTLCNDVEKSTQRIYEKILHFDKGIIKQSDISNSDLDISLRRNHIPEHIKLKLKDALDWHINNDQELATFK